MQLHANRQDDEHAYVRLIRACLEANHGRPNVARRAVVDTGRLPSLRVDRYRDSNASSGAL